MQRTMSLSARQELAFSLSPRYREAKRPAKQKILDEFTAATNYHRKYAVLLLKRDAHKTGNNKERRKPRTYTAEVKDALVAVWQAIPGGNFYPSPSPQTCCTCQFKSRCPVFVGHSIE